MFIETPRFPDAIAYGVTGGPTYETEITRTRGGAEQRNAARSIGLAKYDAAHGVKSQAQMDDLNAFFRVCRGQWAGFRFKDWSDFKLDASNCILGNQIYAVGLPSYQINKKYVVGIYTDLRKIQKPVSISLYKNAVLQSSGYTMDSTTGIITFAPLSTFTISNVTKASPGVVTAAGHTFSNGDLIYIDNVGGMAEVNGRVFTIGGVSGASFNIGINTSAYTTYTSGGSSYKYPQVTDTLYCIGEFDVPCRFATDEMQASIEMFEGYAWNQIPIQEVQL